MSLTYINFLSTKESACSGTNKCHSPRFCTSNKLQTEFFSLSRRYSISVISEVYCSNILVIKNAMLYVEVIHSASVSSIWISLFLPVLN